MPSTRHLPYNTICWCDIPVVDLDRAIAFFSAVLGALVSKQSMPGCDFGLLPHDNNVAGCLVFDAQHGPSLNGPLIYLSVEGRLDAAIAVAVSSGAKIL